MAQSAEELIELMDRGADRLTGQIVKLLDEQGTAEKLGEAYSMWVLPSALMIFASREETPDTYAELQSASEEMERSLERYLNKPCRQRLIQVAADWMGARAVSRRLIEELSA